MPVFVNRTLNLKKIKVIGFDMDHTIVKYHTEKFEAFTYKVIIKKLIELKDYPQEIEKLRFDFNRIIQGLVIDKKLGNVLKLSLFGKVKSAYHGRKRIDFQKQNEIYQGMTIDLNDPRIQSLDTSFSLSSGILYLQLVDLKEKGVELPGFDTIYDDIRFAVNLAHQDGSLKNEVRDNLKKYIVQDPAIPKLMEKLKHFKKKLIIVTNSDYSYTKLLMDYAFNPFLKNHSRWEDIFEICITMANKPKFFTERNSFLKVDPQCGLMSNTIEKIEKGFFQGGSSKQLQKDLGIEGSEILYLGDHIHGDVVSIKKNCNWRTALVVYPLGAEVEAFWQSQDIQQQIDKLMADKIAIETELDDLVDRHIEEGGKDKINKDKYFKKLEGVDNKISKLIKEYGEHFNPYWGELMRAGNEQSFFASQVERYACIYMSQISDLLEYSPRKYFRPHGKIMAHETISRP